MEQLMVMLWDEHPPGATPLDPDEALGLIPSHITTQGELNEWEQNNILQGQMWAMKALKRGDIYTDDYIRTLHVAMFDETWKWAGTYRKTEKSIGVDPIKIAIEVRNLLGDVKAQIEFDAYPIDEIAARLHHRLVLIHPFPNGNGRHARLFTDVFLKRNGSKPFTWGRVSLVQASATRDAYIAALRAADNKNIEPLLAFVRT
jgi:Fic-DOC domain mobile mystery protein B